MVEREVSSAQAKLEALMAEIDAIGFDLSPQTSEQLQAKRRRLLEIKQYMLSDPEILQIIERARGNVRRDALTGERRVLPNVTRITRPGKAPDGS